MRKICSLVVVLCLLASMITMLSVTVSAAESGECGENVTWVFENGVLTISGTGAMKNYEGLVYNAEINDMINDWPEWRELDVKEIVVEEGVTNIGPYAFHGLSEATKISLPSTLTEIKNHAFTFSGIEKLTIPDNVKSIGFYAISDSVKTLEIGSGLKELDGAIQYDLEANLEKITVSEDNPYFSAEDNVLFNKDKTELIRYAAMREGEAYTVPSTVKTICEGAFERSENLKEIIIPEGVEKIEDYAFYCAWEVRNIYLPNSLVEIAVSNFDGFSYSDEFKLTYMGTEEELKAVKILDSNRVGENSDQSGIYEYFETRLPLFGCVDIVYNPIIKVLVNGQKVNFDVYPQIENGRTMVPMRAIFEALGATVEWNNETRSVTSVKDDVTISLAIDSTELYVNGSVKTLDVPACIINNRTMVPVRAISEAFGCEVKWNNDERIVVIES